MPKNYRPISIIPVLSKLFCVALYLRMKDHLEARMTEEQYGFWKGRGCTDAIHILRVVVEKSNEWGENLWMATLDVEKAFDKMHHSSLFDALLQNGADVFAVAALRKLYTGMKAYVQLWPGCESRRITVDRGVRQGDPLSPVLFNLVLRQVLIDVNSVWQKRGYGTEVGKDLRNVRLTHIAFADDVTLIGKSWLQVKRMVLELRAAMLARGLALHPSKCKAQTNIDGWSKRRRIERRIQYRGTARRRLSAYPRNHFVAKGRHQV
jgi:hypothetical protein